MKIGKREKILTQIDWDDIHYLSKKHTIKYHNATTIELNFPKSNTSGMNTQQKEVTTLFFFTPNHWTSNHVQKREERWKEGKWRKRLITQSNSKKNKEKNKRGKRDAKPVVVLVEQRHNLYILVISHLELEVWYAQLPSHNNPPHSPSSSSSDSLSQL